MKRTRIYCDEDFKIVRDKLSAELKISKEEVTLKLGKLIDENYNLFRNGLEKERLDLAKIIKRKNNNKFDFNFGRKIL